MNIVSDLSEDTFAGLLAGDGIVVQIGPFTARIRATVPLLYRPLYGLYKDYALRHDDGVRSFHVQLQRRRAVPRVYRRLIRFTVDGRVPHEDMPEEQALPVLEWGLNLVVALRSHCFLMLHSAVVERNGNALLLPASPGDGKSTLCAGLTHRGWRLLSDEFGLLRPDTVEMIPVPRPMALKNESIDVMRNFAPASYIGPATPNTRKGTVAHVRPSAESVARQAEAATATQIVFPRWRENAPLSLETVSPAEGFMLLATNAFNYELLGEAAFRTVRDLICAARCYRLVYSDLDEATRRLSELSDEYASRV